MVFDAHVYPVDVDGGPQLGSDAAITALMADEGIDRVLLVARDAAALQGHVEAIDGAYAMPWLDPRDPDAPDRAAALLDHPRFVGLKLHPGLDPVDPAGPEVAALLEVAAAHDAPVAVHCGHPIPSLFTLPWVIGEAARRHPEVRFVLVHMGYCVFPYHDGSMDLAAELPNVYLDVSGMPHPWRVKEAVARAGADRVLYGSTAPYHHPRLELRKVQLSNLAPDERDAVLGRTAAALYLGEDR